MNLGIGLSALQASQFAIDNISHNIANAGTEGYHRQDVRLGVRQPQLIEGFHRGSGVDVNHVRRIRDQVIESVYTNSISDLSQIEQQVKIETQIETYLQPGEGSIQNALTGLFDEISRLSANPGERALRTSVVNQGVNLALRTRQLSDQFVGLKDSIGRQLDLEVGALNQELETLVELQNRILTSSAEDIPNDLLDQRDQLINSIADRIDVQRYEQVQDKLGLAIAGSSISIGSVPIRFETFTNDDGTKQVRVEGTERATKFNSGKLLALTETHNSLVNTYQSKVDSFASALIRELDQAHATGLGLGAPFERLKSSRAVDDSTVPLNESGIAFPVDAGELFVTVTDENGQRRTSAISIDPAVDSLQGVATKIGAIANVQAVVDADTGQLSILAQPGFAFDFTGRLTTAPDLSGIAGTSTPAIGGNYTGTINQQLFVEVTGAGTIGKTSGLVANVTDGDGRAVAQIEIGEGYAAGSEIDLGDGTFVSFGPGNVSAGDSFDFHQVANSDTSGILSALGLNSFFEGSNARDIAVSRHIVENPDRIASSRSGEIGDTRNLENFVGLRNRQVLQDGTLTFEDFLAETTAEIGIQVQSSTVLQANLDELNFGYETDRNAVSGVDLNEELLNLAQYQKSYDAAVQVVRTMESMLDTLFSIIR